MLFAFNSTGKTRLCMAFKELGKQGDEEATRDTLYFNAFTEDLFTWDNDLENDTRRVLRLRLWQKDLTMGKWSLGYARWENFRTANQRSMEACEANGHCFGPFSWCPKMVRGTA